MCEAMDLEQRPDEGRERDVDDMIFRDEQVWLVSDR